MSLLSRSVAEKEFDVRMVQRGLSKGLILQEDVEKNQKKLPDDTSNAEYVNPAQLLEAGSGRSSSQE